METAGLKAFAREARRRLKEQVAAKLGVVLAEGSAARREAPAKVAALEAEVRASDAVQVTERVAYLWFNRFCALRFMDVNGLTAPRAVSPAEGDTRPELLAEALAGHLPEDLPAATAARVRDLLDGRIPSRDAQGEAYRLLLVAACNGWNGAMPFLFEGVDDASDLLMPEDLLSADGVLARMRVALSDEISTEVEAIGWLYQFYIAEKKQEVFDGLKKNIKVTPENIPAATQLFTPHWIVRYLVENSLGRLWLLNNPGSALAAHMPYYIAPAEPETDFLRIASPEELRICDPACGSGHMLTYAFDLLHRIYEEAGYDAGEIPALILRHNLYGVEIDERAGALAAFALVMKAALRLGGARRRRFLRAPEQPQVTVLEEVRFRPDELDRYAEAIGRDLFTKPLQETLGQFAEAKNFGSLIRPAIADAGAVRAALEARGAGLDLTLAHVHRDVLRVLAMSEMLAPRYHVVVANPPYMGGSGMNSSIKSWASREYPKSKSDLFAMFIERSIGLVIRHGFSGMITMQSWMFLSTYETLRKWVLSQAPIRSAAHLGERAFDSIGGAVVSTAAFILQSGADPTDEGIFIRAISGGNEREKSDLVQQAASNSNHRIRFRASSEDLQDIPGSPLIYWLSKASIEAFQLPTVSESYVVKKGMATGNNARFIREWHEVSWSYMYIDARSNEETSEGTWFPCLNGGTFRKWYGNHESVVNWYNNGESAKAEIQERTGDHWSRYIISTDLFFRSGMNWSDISSSRFSGRMHPAGYAFTSVSMAAFGDRNEDVTEILALSNSSVGSHFLSALSPSLHYGIGEFKKLPVADIRSVDKALNISRCAVTLAREDWDAYETSWDFARHPLTDPAHRRDTLAETYAAWREQAQAATDEMRRLEEENNRVFIDAYGLQDELTPEVPLHEITLTGNPHYRYGAERAAANGEALMRGDTAKELVSYAIGCLMGRYSLDRPGLVLADAGATADDYRALVPAPTLAPDGNGIVPLTEGEWFADDGAAGVRRFLRAAFGDARFEENLRWLEAALGKDLRRYLAKDFFGDHVKRYRKRPIYWLFSSPKGSFQALAYLHRMTGDTVGLVLNEYLRPMRAKLDAAAIAADETNRSPAASASEKTRALKEGIALRRQIAELDEWERDVLHPLAGKRVTLDLDDGVKRNYPRFGAALRKIPGLEAAED